VHRTWFCVVSREGRTGGHCTGHHYRFSIMEAQAHCAGAWLRHAQHPPFRHLHFYKGMKEQWADIMSTINHKSTSTLAAGKRGGGGRVVVNGWHDKQREGPWLPWLAGGRGTTRSTM
jgi:hypothetical protein